MVDIVSTPWVELELLADWQRAVKSASTVGWVESSNLLCVGKGGSGGLAVCGPQRDGSSARTRPPWSLVAPGIFTASACLGGFRSVVSSFLVKSPGLVSVQASVASTWQCLHVVCCPLVASIHPVVTLLFLSRQ